MAAITLNGPHGPFLRASFGLRSEEIPGKDEVGLYAEEPLKTSEGEILGTLCVLDPKQRSLGARELEILSGLARQVTCRAQHERTDEELSLALRRMDDVERLAHVASWEWDLESDVAVWSPEMHRFLGLEPGVTGNRETFMGLIHKEDRPRVSAIIRHALKDGGSFSYRARFVRPDGEVRTLDSKGQAILDRDSRPAGIQGATVDVTDLVAAEVRGRQQAEGLYAAFETALDPILVVDDDRRYVHVNLASSTLFGYPRKELLGGRLEELVPEENREDAVAVWAAFLRKGQLQGEIELLCADGSIARAEYSATANFVPNRHLVILRDVTERRRDERATLEVRRRLEETQALAEVGSWEWDLADELTLTSPHLLQILKRDPGGRMSYGEFVGHLHPEDRDDFVSSVQDAVRESGEFRLVFRVVSDAGEVRSIESHGRVEVDEQGTPMRMYGAAQDITERRRVESDLRIQADVLHQLPAGIIASDADRRITQWNRGAETLFGIMREEALGSKVDDLDLIAPSSDRTRRRMQERLAAGEMWEGEIELKGPGESTFPALVTNSPTRDQNGEIVGYVGVTVDLRDQQRIESELLLQGQLLDQVEAGVIALDRGRRVTHWNRGAEKLYGWRPNEVMGRTLDEIGMLTSGPGASGDPVGKQIGGGSPWEGEVEAHRKDGSRFPTLTSISPTRDSTGAVTGFVGVSVDITLRKRAEQEAREARLETIHRLARAVEMRDIETGGHIERIGIFSAAIAEKLGLDPDRVELLRISSPMHDVGKIGISDSILLKPGKLTAEEFAEMQRHAEIGHELLAESGSEMLELAATIALSHHEWADGSGYPRGLHREEIPLEGRIVAVADVFDALTSDRVYRPAFSVEEAAEMMRGERATHFDPAVLDALLGNLEAILQLRSGLETDLPYGG